MAHYNPARITQWGLHAHFSCGAAPKRDPSQKWLLQLDIAEEIRFGVGYRWAPIGTPVIFRIHQPYQCIR